MLALKLYILLLRAYVSIRVNLGHYVMRYVNCEHPNRGIGRNNYVGKMSLQDPVNKKVKWV